MLVVRDDLFPYGSKARFLNPFFRRIEENEVVYGSSPRWGFAQISIAYLAKKHGKRATIFLPKSKELSSYSLRTQRLGAEIIQVPMGFTKVCEARAREHAGRVRGLILPCGLDLPEVVQEVGRVARELGIEPEEVWTVAGSGTLTRGLQIAWPKAKFFAIQVGRALSQEDVGKAEIITQPLPFGKPEKQLPPFPSVPEYDAKAWKFIPKDGKKLRLFWNVGGT